MTIGECLTNGGHVIEHAKGPCLRCGHDPGAPATCSCPDCTLDFSLFSRLHNAAPELLLALQHLYIECTDNKGPPSSEAIAKAREAIAKAEGK